MRNYFIGKVFFVFEVFLHSFRVLVTFRILFIIATAAAIKESLLALDHSFTRLPLIGVMLSKCCCWVFRIAKSMVV